MEPKFQTSFIPKKPIASPGISSVRPPHHTVSLYLTLAIIIFILSLAALGGAFVWKQILTTQRQNYIAELAQREQEFNIAKIEELKQTNVKIDTARDLLSKHIAASQIFEVIGRMTNEKVRFTSLSFDTGDAAAGGAKISLSGYGLSLPVVAFQSDVLSNLQQYSLRKVVKNPILSDPSESQTGQVSFGFSAVIDTENLSYKQFLSGALPGSTAGTSTGQTSP